jgi:hypothetical protein
MTAAAIALASSLLFLPMSPVHASTTAVMVHAFWPVIALLQAVAYPVAFLGMAGGMLMISVGQRRKGLEMVKWAAIGYVGMQMVPALMGIISQLGHNMAAHSLSAGLLRPIGG